MRTKVILYFLSIIIFVNDTLQSQQEVDTGYNYKIQFPHYPNASGPKIYIDAAHNNLHTANGGFLPLVNLLEQDGYVVISMDESFNSKELGDTDILIIANPLHESNIGNWVLPNPSAFTPEEIEAIQEWVNNGGSLLLIADHMPYAGAMGNLANVFGFEFYNGFAMGEPRAWPPSRFFIADNSFNARFLEELSCSVSGIDTIASFTGSAFSAPEEADAVLLLDENHRVLLPDTAWVFNSNTRTVDAKGLLQGSVMAYGNGKLAVFGEAAMFTAQILNGNFPAGFNSDTAPDNAAFILELVHWLSSDNLKD